jgi:UDP-glucose 4-epimerase
MVTNGPTVVVVGGCGFLGRHLTAHLMKRGARIRSVHRSSEHDLGPRGECLAADYHDTTSLKPALADAEALVHLGSGSVPRSSIMHGPSGVQSEVAANVRLFEAAARLGIPRVVFASSGGAVYGMCPPGAPIREDRPLRPISAHGWMKARSESALARLAAAHGLTAVALRSGNVYGPGQHGSDRFGAVPTFITNLVGGLTSEIWGPDVVRDYVYVDDAVAAFSRAVLADDPLPPAINIGTGVGHTTSEVFDILQAALQTQVRPVMGDAPPTDPTWSVLSPDLAAQRLSWRAEVSLEVGLLRTVAAHRAQ